VTEGVADVVPAIMWLTRHLFPFNYVIPGQSHNNLVHLPTLLARAPYAHLSGLLQGYEADEDPQDGFIPEENPFSGSSYRMINFICDFPVRVDHLVPARYGALLGRTAFVQVEFQVLDRETARANEEGENAHRLYKERQRAIVASRLRKGGRYRRTKAPGRNGRSEGAPDEETMEVPHPDALRDAQKR
jgi:uncharacterized protein (TIGR04552 family)